MVPRAAKDKTLTAVAPSRGTAFWATTSLAASNPSIPCSMRIFMPSTTTMALSTSMPSAMISAPKDMRCRAMLYVSISAKVPAIVSNRMNPIISPLRNPMEIKSTPITMTTDSARFTKNPLTALVTVSDCMAMGFSSMPTGICCISSSIRAFTASPMTTAFPPEAVEIAIPMAGRPLNLKIAWGGST